MKAKGGLVAVLVGLAAVGIASRRGKRVNNHRKGSESKIITTQEWGAKVVPVQPTSPMVGIVIHHMAIGSGRGTRGVMREPGKTPETELEQAKKLARNVQTSHMTPQKWVPITNPKTGETSVVNKGGPGWSDTGQHFTISRGGVILEGRTGSLEAAMKGMVVRGAHAKGANLNRIGIEVEGDYTAGHHYGDETPEVPPAQWAALVRLVRLLVERGALDPSSIVGHRDVSGNHTGCPGTLGDRLPELRAAAGAWA